MEERIRNLIGKHPLSRKVLLEFFSDEKEAEKTLNRMIVGGEVALHRDKLYLPEQIGLKKARIVSVRNHFAFALLSDEEEDVYIDQTDLHGAFLDDVVYLKMHGNAGEVFSIIEKSRKRIVGEVVFRLGKCFLETKDIATEDTEFILNAGSGNLVAGTIVSAAIVRQEENRFYLDVAEVIGHKNDPGADIARIILNHGADLTFGEEVLKQVRTVPDHVDESELAGRVDFRDHRIVTIDGEDAKDFDDAVEIRRTSRGYEIGVHIADVAHYVCPGTPLDREALSRGTSIYVTDRVVPMLPFELSNGICSLNPGVDRLVTSCIFEIDPFGNVLESKIVKGVIRSSARLTYTYVNRLLNHELKKEEHLSEEIDQMLFLLHEAANKIRKKRKRAGAIDLESTELVFLCTKEGQPYEVVKRKQGKGEELIEDLMIAANEIVASAVERLQLPFAYRIHEQPKSKKMETFMKISAHLGYKCDFSPLSVTPKELSSHLDRIQDRDKKEILSMILLRSLAKARYASENRGHYGLASQTYCHFTSPIRRYPDLCVHRLIDRYLIGKNLRVSKEFSEEIAYICETASMKERRAMSIEREVDDLESAKFMADKVGNVFSGRINGMSAKGIFVELENGIDGFLDFEEIADDFYVFDERYLTATGKRTGRRFQMGDRLRVRLIRADVESYQIVFSLIDERKAATIKNESGRKRKHGRN